MDEYTSEIQLGAVLKITHYNEDGEELGYELQGSYDNVYDEDDSWVSCPHCEHDEIIYSAGGYYCPKCEDQLSASELEDFAGPIHL